ncbi:MAG: signal recognition particle-docking protein FtsY [Bdellovibrionaceae bacterium]|nr:signal recognition particle-docking protein FtsY [Pseudobdellovibrionaceae bacterium]
MQWLVQQWPLLVAVVILLLFFFLLYPKVKSSFFKNSKATLKKQFTAKPSKEAVTFNKNQDLFSILEKSRSSWSDKLKIFSSKTQVLNDEDMESLEELLYGSDLGPKTAHYFLEKIQKKDNLTYPVLLSSLKLEMLNVLNLAYRDANTVWTALDAPERKDPVVWLISGVNGAGKTTSIGKLAYMAHQKGYKVLMASADTFRAAAQEQLVQWSKQAGVCIFAPEDMKDPSAVAYNACQKAKAQNYDLVLIDTAGRLHTQSNLMNELEKIKKVVKKLLPQSPQESFLVLDANSGQNACVQAENFHRKLNITGVLLTKLDGSSKGGVAISLAKDLHLPVLFLGMGESLKDIQVFAPKQFVSALMGNEE